MKLNKVIVASALLTATLFASGGTHWGYTGHGAPSNWGDLDPKYQMCKLGSSQSPINITKSVQVETKGLEKIGFNYKTGASSIINNGHTVQVNVESGSSIKVDGKVFELKQFHFHTPSENQIEGKHFPLEAHFVHVAKDGSIAVVAILFQDGKSNPILEKVWSKMPHEAGEKAIASVVYIKTDGPANALQKVGEKSIMLLSAGEINALLPEDKSYYRFSGSLTTPPCSEGVRWLVFKSYKSISKAQVEQFLHTMHHPNNRPVQDIGARKVLD